MLSGKNTVNAKTESDNNADEARHTSELVVQQPILDCIRMLSEFRDSLREEAPLQDQFRDTLNTKVLDEAEELLAGIEAQRIKRQKMLDEKASVFINELTHSKSKMSDSNSPSESTNLPIEPQALVLPVLNEASLENKDTMLLSHTTGLHWGNPERSSHTAGLHWGNPHPHQPSSSGLKWGNESLSGLKWRDPDSSQDESELNPRKNKHERSGL